MGGLLLAKLSATEAGKKSSSCKMGKGSSPTAQGSVQCTHILAYTTCEKKVEDRS